MISPKTRQLLLFLALLLAWGETLASPFVGCLHEQHAMGREAAHFHHAVMHADDMQMSAMPPAHLMHAESNAGHGDNMHGTMQHSVAGHAMPSAADCDNSCAFCRGMSMSDLVAPLLMGMPLLLSWDSPAPALSVAVPPPSDHFRPPALG